MLHEVLGEEDAFCAGRGGGGVCVLKFKGALKKLKKGKGEKKVESSHTNGCFLSAALSGVSRWGFSHHLSVSPSSRCFRWASSFVAAGR